MSVFFRATSTTQPKPDKICDSGFSSDVLVSGLSIQTKLSNSPAIGEGLVAHIAIGAVHLKISVVIPVINEAQQLEQSVTRAWQSGAHEVVVVDGGSTDSTQERAAELDCILTCSPPGRALQLNCGAKAASGDVLLFLHADNWLVADACEQVEELFRTTVHRFGGFRQKIENPRRAFRWIESGNAFRLTRMGLIYGDQAMFVHRDLFHEVGGFPELELMEDFEISRSLKSHGEPALLEGPTFVSARRWERVGLFRQTALNWCLSTAYRCGASPAWIARRYRRHDK